MQLTREDDQFRREIEQFVHSHWEKHAQLSLGLRQQHWRQALLDRGWSVPFWPTEFGGCGWSATQKFLWFKTCARAGVMRLCEQGVDVVAPLLFPHVSKPLVDGWLNDIRGLASRWCVAVTEPASNADEDLRTKVRASEAGWRIDGVKSHVVGAMHADMACVLSTAPISEAPTQDGPSTDQREGRRLWVVVPMHAVGISLQGPSETDVSMASRLILDHVEVVEDGLLTEVANHPRGDLVPQAQVLSQSGLMLAQCHSLDESLSEFAQDDPCRGKLVDIHVQIAALEALEWRYVDAVQRGVELPFTQQVLTLRGYEIFTQLGDLQVQSFGYYALPYPDEMLLHNEGPIGSVGG